MKVLVVTNDYPPRPGGIQAFVHSLASRLRPEEVVVYASNWSGAAEFDAAQAFPVVRHSTSLMLPTPAVHRRAAALAREHGAMRSGSARRRRSVSWRPRCVEAGVQRFVASTHGHEVGWALLPGARQMLRRIGTTTDVVTYLGDYTRKRLEPAFGPRATLAQLPSGVDSQQFSPSADGELVRRRHGLADRPVIACVSRLVPRKGQDVLIRALPLVQRRIPEAALLLVGGGPYRETLQRLARENGVERDVVLTGSVPWEELPAHYAAGDVFSMPCRTRRGGLEVEGLGIVFLEANATGLPVVAGDSGGSPDAVREGETGYVVDGRNPGAVADKLTTLLADEGLRRRMGAAGRAWVEDRWRWDVLADRLRGLLDGSDEHPADVF